MNYVNLDKLTKVGSKISWKDSIGETIDFKYGSVYGNFEIIDYDGSNRKVKVIYDNNEFCINSQMIKKCNLGGMLMLVTKDFKYKTGTFKNEYLDINIIGMEYRASNRKDGINENKKWYKYTCNKCGWTEGWIEESKLKRQRCSCCANQTAVLGINTIWDTDRWMVDLGVSEEDAKKYTSGSNKKVEVTCPDCGNKKNSKIADISNVKSICCTCGDGFSYPEKFMYSLLKQLNIDFKFQLSKKDFDWCDKYKYDFYIPNLNIIIETHGSQHYSDNTKFVMTLEEVKLNDYKKQDLAFKNGINKYVVINCSTSNIEHMKDSIYFELKDTLDLNIIDWDKCSSFALKNIVKDVCDYWNNKEEYETAKDISNLFSINVHTIRRYLGNGSDIGWCTYDGKEEMKKRGYLAGKNSSVAIEMFDPDGVSLGIFESARELSRISQNLFGIKLNSQNISAVCVGKRKTYKNFKFKHL